MSWAAMAVFLAMAAPAGADPPESGPPEPPRPPHKVSEEPAVKPPVPEEPAHGERANKRERLRERIRAMRAWYLTEQLALDEAGAARLFPLLGRFDDRLEELHQRGVKLRNTLRRQMAAAKADRAAMNQVVDDLLQHYEDLYRVQRDRFAAVRNVVTPEQAARLLLVLPEVDDAIRGQIKRAMRGEKHGDEGRRKNRARRPDSRGGGGSPFTDHF